MVLKELIFNNFYCWGGCGGLERTDLSQFLLLGGCVDLEITPFLQFLLWEELIVWKELNCKLLYWEGVVVLKEPIFNSFYYGRVSWS